MTHLLLAVIYAAFIAFGLPDSLLGSAWPSIYPQMEVPVSYAGMVSLIIAMGTVVSSLLSDRTTKKLGCGRVAAISVGMTAAALLGFSFSRSFWMLCLWAIPYGLGAGGVDAAMNNYVALHYSSRHMSWLHCMWGVGASVGPYIMGFALTGGLGWPAGYQIVAAIQIVITLILVLSLPLWKGQGNDGTNREAAREQPLKLSAVLRIPGAKEVLLMFVCYCSREQTAGLWSASYLVIKDGLPAESAASYASLFYLGITAGRGISGFVTMKLNDTRMIRLGMGILTAGVIVMLLPLGTAATAAA